MCTTLSLMRCRRWLPCGDWSKISEITQLSLAQNFPCAAESAKPPGPTALMLAEALFASGRVYWPR